jgi:hypothetical protein
VNRAIRAAGDASMGGMDDKRNSIEGEEPWAASDGLPEVADDDSYSDSVHESVRDRDVDRGAPLPPDREDGPLGLDEFGVTSAERTRGEPLTARLHRELPDVGDDWGYGDPNPRLAQERDQDLAGQLDTDEEALTVEVVDPRLDSQVSMYDRPVPGIPDRDDLGEIVRPGSGYRSVETDEIGHDLGGASMGGLGGEEQAMHEMPDDEFDLEQAQSTHEPYVVPEVGRSFRTGSEQPWEPEDLAVAEGHDPTPRNVERARRELEEMGPAAIEKTVP